MEKKPENHWRQRESANQRCGKSKTFTSEECPFHIFPWLGKTSFKARGVALGILSPVGQGFSAALQGTVLHLAVIRFCSIRWLKKAKLYSNEGLGDRG